MLASFHDLIISTMHFAIVSVTPSPLVFVVLRFPAFFFCERWTFSGRHGTTCRNMYIWGLFWMVCSPLKSSGDCLYKRYIVKLCLPCIPVWSFVVCKLLVISELLGFLKLVLACHVKKLLVGWFLLRMVLLSLPLCSAYFMWWHGVAGKMYCVLAVALYSWPSFFTFGT